MKASSNSGGVKQLLLQHIEKIILGVAVLLVAVFLWSAMGVQPLDASKQPDKLLAAANAQSQRIQSSTPPEQLVATRDNGFEAAVKTGLEPVAINQYDHTRLLAPPIQPPVVKRPEPTLFPVESLRATATMISVAEIGTVPVWTDPEKTKPKALKKEIRPGFEEERGKRIRRGRNQPGYGGAGYGGASQPGYGQPGYGQTKGADADRSGGKAGYGQTAGKAGYGGVSPQPGYGATGPKAGYGATGPKAGYGATSDRGETRGGYGAGGYGAGGYGAGGYGGMSGGKPGVDVSNQQSQGDVTPAVVLTGRVPYQKQFDEFQKKFREAAHGETMMPEQDQPVYAQFKVERQEVTPAGDGKWTEINLDETVKSEGRWAVSAVQEEVDQAYFDPVLAWPLPPTILRNWGRLAGHPTIPFVWMAEQTTALPTPAAMTAQDIQAMKAERTRTFQPQGFGYGGGTGYGGDGRYGGLAGGLGDTQAMVAPTPAYLFRFVDTQNLEAGKEYRYRVTLALQNPNFGMDPGILEDAASTTVENKWTPPAESAPITVPGKGFLYALSAKVQSRLPGDYMGHMLYHIWNEKMGAEIAKEFDLAIGGTAEFVSTVENWYNPYTAIGEKLENVHFAFKDGAPMLADVAGGEKVAGIRELEQPAELLFIDAQGRMFTSNQARGSPASEFYKERYVVEPPADAMAEPTAAPPGLVQPRGNYGGAR